MMARMAATAPNPAYRISTDRLLLRCWSPRDAKNLRACLDRSDAHLRPWIPFMKDEPRSLEGTVAFLRENRAMFDRDENYRYAVFDAEETQLLGEVMLLGRAGPDAQEIGYWMDVRHSGKGYCSEAVAAMVKVGFAINQVERLEIHCSPENVASVRVAEKLGFELEATLKDRFRNPAGEISDTMVWSLFAAKYPDSQASARSLECFDAKGAALVF